ncbi:polyamine deacetylase HDAC10 isoform X2 [Paramormyrops kingsleyae]|uniref:polyamine deacetylase HDAC10 isoform X2 n=1 Tax=Paramormyrops kingsleyae TaxID=1676925 RepID=UPI000CD65CE7|nr:histone deacetylase 10 isoform X2 [Paramormyrops kingsleyae]
MASGTALIYDEEMTRYKLLWVDPICKIEVPERLVVSYAALQKAGLTQRCVALPVREATDEDILLAHSTEYLEAVKKTPYMTLEELMTFAVPYGDVYFHPNIYHCAKLAIGATLNLVDAVMTGKVRNGIALVRPPGHHSQRSTANGFCIFNNVAIGTLYAKKKYNVRRVLIVDWDIHHGQGLQYCFEEDPDVLYFSWHRYEHQKFWPNLRESDYDSVGKGRGAGFNINLPWNKVGMDSNDYLSVFFHVLLPVAYEFNPELVMLSAGFDSAIGDPEGEMCATPEIFGHLTHLLMSLAGGRLCAVLEGGYNLTSLPQSVCQTVQTLLGDPVSRISGLSSPSKSALESIQSVRSVHQQYWACFKHVVLISIAAKPGYEPHTKHSKLEAGQDGLQPGEETKEISWPEPLLRLPPPTRTAVALPAGLEDSVPESCKRVTETLLTPEEAAEKLGNLNIQDLKNKDLLQSLGNVQSLVDKIEKKQVRNGLLLVPDLRKTLAFAVQHALISLTDRVLLVFLGNEAPVEVRVDGKLMLVQFCSTEPHEPKSKHHIPVMMKGFGDVPGFLHAVLTLLLPLAYGYDPGLILVAMGKGSGMGVAAWTQLTSLLQGLAEGQMLVLMQGDEEETIRTTAASLLGEPAQSLGTLGDPLPESMDAVEKLRLKLETQWGLLQTRGQNLPREPECLEQRKEEVDP